MTYPMWGHHKIAWLCRHERALDVCDATCLRILREAGLTLASATRAWVIGHPKSRVRRDGLSGTVDRAQLCAILGAHPDPHSASRALVHAAQQASAGDDVTALVIVYDPR